jgi:hypothetical protein
VSNIIFNLFKSTIKQLVIQKINEQETESFIINTITKKLTGLNLPVKLTADQEKEMLVKLYGAVQETLDELVLSL